MELLKQTLQEYSAFQAQEARDRFFKHEDLLAFLEYLARDKRFLITRKGESAEGRAIHIVQFGQGPAKIFLWSQMHGNEATATMALLDLFNLLRADNNPLSEILFHNCILYVMPMVNPDGAEVFTRRNAMGIDINRDYHHQQTPEGRLLRSARDEINPDFGFNLHDQTTMWSAGESGNPATISLLAPAYDHYLSINPVRERAMQVIVEMNKTLQQIIPDHVGRFDDEYEPRAFGDNFQAAGTSTILIEAGGFANDPEKQQIRKHFFAAMIQGLLSIAQKTYSSEILKNYYAIPDNKLYHFQILLRNTSLDFGGQNYRADIGLIVKEGINPDLKSVSCMYLIGDLGDLSNRFGYDDVDCSNYKLIQTSSLIVDEPAHLILMDGLELLLEIENGIITTNNL